MNLEPADPGSLANPQRKPRFRGRARGRARGRLEDDQALGNAT